MNIIVKLYSEFIAGSGCTKALADMGGSTGVVMSNSPAIFARLGLEYESISFELPIERHIERLQTFKPDLLYTMPSILDHIVYAAENPRAFGIRKMILLGEFTTPKWRRNMARLFGIEPHDIMVTYGSTELGLIASYSHHLDRYILVDGIFAEGIATHELGGEFEPLGKNESILVLTSLNRKLFPALRFVTYDVVRDFRPVMVNGAERQSFESIVKRVGRELKHGEKISLYDIEQAVYRHVEDAMIRVKVRNNSLTVYIKSKSAVDSLISTIREEIMDCIPEIGTMIRNRLLNEIEVIWVANDEQLLSGLIKNKKIYYESGEF
ncbi:CoF synthetase [Brevibacillus sp. H7]|uniref:CoF synthetase n=1 Tax=Brevibacillus sp. H7 TaxID=3349138 RepID=UPI00380A9DF1